MKQIIFAFILLASVAYTHSATIYQVDIDTSSIAGGQGSISLQLGILGNPDPLNVTVSNFSVVGGVLGGFIEKCFGLLPCPIVGELPADGELVFENSDSFVEYFQTITWGTALRFQIAFAGPAISNPIPNADPSTFEILLLDEAGVMALLSDDPLGLGRLASWNIDENGISLENLSENGAADITEIPEPASMWLVVGGCLLALRRFANYGSGRRFVR